MAAYSLAITVSYSTGFLLEEKAEMRLAL